MAVTSLPATCFPSIQCLNGIVNEECLAAGVACVTSAFNSNNDAAMSPQSPENHVSPIYLNAPASTGSQVVTTSSDSEDSLPQPERRTNNPPRPTRPHRRIPHTIIERRYRDNLKSQIELLRLSLPSLKNAYETSPDLEDSALPPRLPSKAIIIATAASYIKELEAEREQAMGAVRDLQLQVGELQKLVQCNDCSILQYLQAVGGGEQQQQQQQGESRL